MALILSAERALSAAAVVAAVQASVALRTLSRSRAVPARTHTPCALCRQAHGLDAATTRVVTAAALLPDGTVGAEASGSAAVIVSHAPSAAHHRCNPPRAAAARAGP